MIAAHRYNFRRAPLGWTSAMNLFGLVFALLLALAIVVLLMLCFELMQRQAQPAQAEPAHTAQDRMMEIGPSTRVSRAGESAREPSLARDNIV
jgi:uncharacterized membrane protein